MTTIGSIIYYREKKSSSFLAPADKVGVASHPSRAVMSVSLLAAVLRPPFVLQSHLHYSTRGCIIIAALNEQVGDLERTSRSVSRRCCATPKATLPSPGSETNHCTKDGEPLPSCASGDGEREGVIDRAEKTSLTFLFFLLDAHIMYFTFFACSPVLG